jgi:YfiH family protein
VAEAGLLLPDWELPPGVFACVTTRVGGCSRPPFDSFNLGTHVGDDPAAVTDNRLELQALLRQHTGLAEVPVQWLQQVHGTAVLELDTALPLPTTPEADAIHTRVRGIACAVLTADCLPVLFCADDGSEVAVAHAGWRGLVNGVLERALQQFSLPPERIRAWLGPAIAVCHFEVGAEVREQFLAKAAPGTEAATRAAFHAAAAHTGAADKYFADLHVLARLRLHTAGVADIAGAPRCTVCDAGSWYSYRRDGATGRFATLILRS